MFNDSNLFTNAKRYAEHNGITIESKEKLGFGTDGTVWDSSRNSAVKALYLERTFQRELDAYKRIAEHGLDSLHGLFIPQILGHDDELLVIEMTIVQPPFLLDFGKAYVDQKPPYWDDPQLVANARAEWAELFEDRWPEVESLLAALEKYGIYYVDPRPGNIVFSRADLTG